jgi:hypothetical protein
LRAGIITEDQYNEADGPEDSGDQEVRAILNQNYDSFVQQLGANIKDPKFRNAIKNLATKEKVDFKEIDPKVSRLLPTQNEIDVDKSLRYPLTSAASVEPILKGGTIAVAGKKIVTAAGGRYIVDGHHRWSQVYVINPNCAIAAIDLSNINNPMDALKATQLGIAADIGKVPVASVKGSNLLTIGRDALINYVVTTITPDVVTAFIKSGKLDKSVTSGQGLAELANQDKMEQKLTKVKYAIGEYIWKNVEQMQKNNRPVSGAPKRDIMPQTDDAAGWKGHSPDVDNII